MEIFRQITANNVTLRQYPFLKELAMEAYLIENEDILKLDEENFSDVSIIDAEIALKKGRKDGNGRIDILAKYGLDYFSIIELKIGEINDETLIQLEEYFEEKIQLLNTIKSNYGDSLEGMGEPKWVGVVIGDSISVDLQQKLQNGYKTSAGVPIAGMTLKRFKSNNNEIFVITDTYFKYNYTNKDFSKFSFNNSIFNKGRLVNNVIKKYVEKYPNITLAELKNKIPLSLQGSLGTFIILEDAVRKFEKSGTKRFYIGADETISLSDCTIATSNQWGLGNIQDFIKHINKIEPNFDITNS